MADEGPELSVTSGSADDLKSMSAAFDKMNAFELLAADKSKVTFGSLFAGRKVILAIIRHFGDYVSALGKSRSKLSKELKEANVEIIVVGCGSPAQIASYKKDSFDGEMYTDPTRKIHETIGLKVAQSLGDLTKGPKKHEYSSTGFGSGFLHVLKTATSTGEQGNMYQLGGEFVLGPGNSCHFFHLDTSPTDVSNIDELLKKAGVKLPEKK